MKRLSALLCGLALMSMAVNCNVNQELINGLRGLLGQNVNAAAFAQGCENFAQYIPWEFKTTQIDQFASQAQTFRWLKGNHQRNLGAHLKDLKFGKKAVALTFENHIVASGRSGVIAKALVAIKTGDQISARVALGSSTCDMKQMYNQVKYRDCKRILFWKKCSTKTKNVPRGFHPHELNAVLNNLQYSAAKIMFDESSKKTGLKSQNSVAGLESLYVTESHTLRKFYPEIQYDYTEMVDVPLNQLPSAIRESSMNQITDGSIFQRIQQISGANSRSSFFYAPNASSLFVISANKSGSNYLVRMSSFKVNGRLPAGAFAVSVGAWSLERAGQGTTPSSQELVKVFPPLK